MDPYAVLGLTPGASEQEATAAWKRLAKRWHPDRAGAGDLAVAKMAEINAAYDLVREDRAKADTAAANAAGTLRRDPDAPMPHESHGIHVMRRPPRRAGAWLDEPTRKAVGRELLVVLEDGEEIRLITRASTWASPEAHLVVTDRRLLWLLDDAITNRVRSLHFRSVADVEQKLAWPRRRTATLRVRTTEDRKLEFSELDPATAAAVARHVRAGLPKRR